MVEVPWNQRGGSFRYSPDYVALYKPETDFVSQISSAAPLSQSESGGSDSVCGKNVYVLKVRFKKQKLKEGLGGGSKKSELDLYLNEAALEESVLVICTRSIMYDHFLTLLFY